MRGGQRVGSGQKGGVVIGSIEPRSPAQFVDIAALQDGTHPLLEPPGDLCESAQGVWREYARFAIEQLTLTEATVAGFRQLCQQWAYLVDVEQAIQSAGAGTKEAEPFLRTYLKLAQRLDSSLARFRLTAFGKAAVTEKPKKAANPWAQVLPK